MDAKQIFQVTMSLKAKLSYIQDTETRESLIAELDKSVADSTNMVEIGALASRVALRFFKIPAYKRRNLLTIIAAVFPKTHLVNRSAAADPTEEDGIEYTHARKILPILEPAFRKAVGWDITDAPDEVIFFTIAAHGDTSRYATMCAEVDATMVSWLTETITFDTCLDKITKLVEDYTSHDNP